MCNDTIECRTLRILVSFFRNGLRTAVAAEIPQCVAPCEKLRPRSSLRHIETICRRAVIFPFCPSYPKITLCLSGHSGRHIPHHLEHLIEMLVREDDCSSGKADCNLVWCDTRNRSSSFTVASACSNNKYFRKPISKGCGPGIAICRSFRFSICRPPEKGTNFLLQTEAAAYRLQFRHPPSIAVSKFFETVLT